MSRILELVEKGRVFEINPKDLGENFMTIEEMTAIFNFFDAFWEYDGQPSPEKTHALLKSGKHSNGFIACKNVLQYLRMCKLFSYEMFKHFERAYSTKKVDVVVSSAYSAINLGYEVARLMGKINPQIEYVIAEKDGSGKPTVIRGGIDPSKTVLVVNELMTTGNGSTLETRQAVLACNGSNPAPKIIDASLVLVHRSKDFVLADGSMVIPVFHFDIEDYEADDCPYCKAGSEAIKPKVGNNWNIIHGRV